MSLVVAVPVATGSTASLTPGAVSTFAGSGSQVPADGTGLAAAFAGPDGAAVAGGSLYLTDAGPNGTTIRKVVLSTGQVSTLAGSTSSIGCVDSTNPAQVTFRGSQLAADGTYLYSLCQNSGWYLRRTNISTGATSTLANVSAYRASSQLTVGSDGAVYLPSSGVVRVDATTGAVSQYAPISGFPSPPSGYSYQWYGITADSSDLWITATVSNSSTGVVSGWDLFSVPEGSSSPTATLVGTYSSEWGQYSLVSSGSYLYADAGQSSGNDTSVVQITKATGASALVAGSGSSGYLDGTGESAWFGSVAGVASDGTNLWVSDGLSYRVREITPTNPPAAGLPVSATTTLTIGTGRVATFAGNSSYSPVKNGVGPAATFVGPTGIVATGGYLFVYDAGAGQIRKIQISTGTVTTLSGSGANSHCSDNTDPTQATFANVGVNIATDGVALYTACNYGGFHLRRTDIATGATSTVATIGDAQPLALGPDGAIYQDGGGIQKIDPNTGAVSTYVAASAFPTLPPGDSYQWDGLASDNSNLWITVDVSNYNTGFVESQLFSIPIGSSNPTPTLVGTYSTNRVGEYSLASAGDYLYTDTYLNRSGGWDIVRITKASGALVSIAGGSQAGFSDGTGAQALFNQPESMVSDGTSLWVADTNNYRIRRVTAGVAGAAVTPADYRGQENGAKPCPCNTAHSLAVKTHKPVDDQFGTFWHTFDDLAVPGRGLALDLSRTYSSDSASLSSSGLFGPGWWWSYGMSLSVSGSTVTVLQENGSQAVFNQSGASYTPAQANTEATLIQNADGTWTFTRHATQTVTFNSSGQLTGEKDLNGDTTSVTYPSGSQMVVTDPAGRTLTATISNGHITSVTDTAGRSVTYGYNDAYGDLTDVVDANGGHSQFVYNSSHQLLVMVSPRYYTGTPPTPPANCASTPPADVVSNVYDSSGRVVCQWDEDGRQTSFDYTSIPGASKVTDPKGNVTVDYFTNGLLTSETQGYGTSQAATWSFYYDPVSGGISEVVDPNGHASYSYYDNSGNKTATVDALGRVTTWAYNSYNEVTSTTPPATYGSAGAVTTTYTYDEPAYSSGGTGNLTTVSTPVLSPTGASEGTQVTHYVHGDSSHPGDVTSMIDPGGNTWSYTYDSYGDKISQTAPTTSDNSDGTGSRSNVTKWSYNTSTGWVTAELSPRYVLAHPTDTTCTAPAVGCTNHTYDNMGRVLTTTDGNGHVTTSHYDADGNLDYSIDADNNKTTYTHDPAGQLTVTTRPDTTTTKTNYWPDGSVEDQIDATNADTHYIYDPLGHLSGGTDPDNRATGYTYDAAGNLVVKADPGVSGCTTSSTTKGCTIYSYDAANELTSVNYNDPGVTPNVTAVSYDADGRRTSMTEQVHGSTTSTVTSTWSFDSLGRTASATDLNGKTVGYGYDNRSNVTSITYPGTTGTVNQTYDPAGRVHSTSDWLNNTTTYAYDANSNLATQTAPTTGTAVVDTSSFDSSDNLTSITTTQGSTTIDSFNYGLDPNNQVTSVTSTGVPSDNHTYRYNSLNQLIQVDSNATYSYDSADNPSGLSGGTTQAFDPANQLCWSATTIGSGCSTPPTGATTYSYDNRGDLTTITPPAGAATTLAYDQAKRLTSYGTSSTYTYNADGLRMTKTVGGTTENYTYDQADHILVDGTTNYIYGPDGQVLEQITGTIPTWYHHDRLGSTRALTDNTGAVAGTFTYDPYGNQTASTGTTTTPIGYAGAYKDAETGLLYLINRYYNPATAQFLTRDPLDAQTHSAYGYVSSDPLNGTDPTGLVQVAPGDNGSGLSIGQILEDPSVLKDLNPDDLLNALGGVPSGFTIAPGQSKSAGLGPGWKLSSPEDGGVAIRWSPGSARPDHPETPYWRVSGGGTYGTSPRVPAAEWPAGAPDFVNGPPAPAGGSGSDGDPCLAAFTGSPCGGFDGGYGDGSGDDEGDGFGFDIGLWVGSVCASRLEI